MRRSRLIKGEFLGDSAEAFRVLDTRFQDLVEIDRREDAFFDVILAKWKVNSHKRDKQDDVQEAEFLERIEEFDILKHAIGETEVRFRIPRLKSKPSKKISQLCKRLRDYSDRGEPEDLKELVERIEMANSETGIHGWTFLIDELHRMASELEQKTSRCVTEKWQAVSDFRETIIDLEQEIVLALEQKAGWNQPGDFRSARLALLIHERLESAAKLLPLLDSIAVELEYLHSLKNYQNIAEKRFQVLERRRQLIWKRIRHSRRGLTELKLLFNVAAIVEKLCTTISGKKTRDCRIVKKKKARTSWPSCKGTIKNNGNSLGSRNISLGARLNTIVEEAHTKEGDCKSSFFLLSKAGTPFQTK